MALCNVIELIFTYFFGFISLIYFIKFNCCTENEDKPKSKLIKYKMHSEKHTKNHNDINSHQQPNSNLQLKVNNELIDKQPNPNNDATIKDNSNNSNVIIVNVKPINESNNSEEINSEFEEKKNFDNSNTNKKIIIVEPLNNDELVQTSTFKNNQREIENFYQRN